MGLIDLKTDLKSLRYGKDRIFGGSSNQPYIIKDIPEGYSSLNRWLDNDFILRGGINAVVDSGTDVLRLGKMFIDTKSPNGVFFTIKQNLLSRTAVRTQTSGKILNEGVYTPLSTLVQAGVNFAGIHVNKQGLNPFEKTGAYSTSNSLYWNKVKYLNSVPTTELTLITENLDDIIPPLDLILGTEGYNSGGLSNITIPIASGKQTAKYSFTNRLVNFYDTKIAQNSANDVDLYSYNGGPGSILGVGKTHIRFADGQRTGISNPNYTGSAIYQVVNGEGKLEAGGIINLQTAWNKSEFHYPTNNVNTPQKDQYKSIPSGSDTWTAKQNTEKYSGFTSGSSLTTASFDKPVSPFVLNNDLITKVVPENEQSTWASTPDQTTPEYNWYSGSSATKEFISKTNESFQLNKFFNLQTGEKLWTNSVYNSGSTFPDGTNPANFDNGTVTYNQSMLVDVPKSETKPSGVPLFQDFRKVIRDTLGDSKIIEAGKKSGQLTDAPDYLLKNTDFRNQHGQPGDRTGKDYSNYALGVKYSDGKYKALDEINASAIGSPVGDWNDLVTFNIVPISGEGAMTFRAFLGSISDSYSANINPHQFVGRGETFYTYGGFDRKFSLSWTVYAQSKPELIPMYQKLSFLASNLAPIYKNGFMQGPLVKLSIGGYFRDMPGYITGLNYELSEESTWDIQINPGGYIDRDTSELPHMIKVSSFQFVPIPTYLPQQGAPMIDIWNGQDFSRAYSKAIAENDGRQYGQTIRGLANINSNGTYVPGVVNGGTGEQ